MFCYGVIINAVTPNKKQKTVDQVTEAIVRCFEGTSSDTHRPRRCRSLSKKRLLLRSKRLPASAINTFPPALYLDSISIAHLGSRKCWSSECRLIRKSVPRSVGAFYRRSGPSCPVLAQQRPTKCEQQRIVRVARSTSDFQRNSKKSFILWTRKCDYTSVYAIKGCKDLTPYPPCRTVYRSWPFRIWIRVRSAFRSLNLTIFPAPTRNS